MGRLISEKIPSLTQGVSQQAPELRRPSQAEDQLNCWNSFVYGMSKRPGGVFQAEYVTPEGFINEGAQWEFLDYGMDFGRFVVAFDVQGKIIAFKEDGTPVKVTGETRYLRLHSTDIQGRKYTVLPYGTAAFVLNKAAPVLPRPEVILDDKTCPLPHSEGRTDFLMTFARPANGSDYSFNINGTDVALPATTTPEQAARHTTMLLAQLYPSFSWKQSGAVIYGKGPYGTTIALADGSDGGCMFHAQASVKPTEQYAGAVVGFVHVKQGDYGTKYKVTITVNNKTVTVAHTTPDGAEASQRAAISLEAIRDNILSSIERSADVTCSRVGASGIAIRAKDRGAIVRVSAVDDVNNNAIRAFDTSVVSEDDLPHQCIEGYTVRVSAKQSDAAYYLRYQGEDSADAGMWMETPKPMEQYKVWGDTLPHLLAPMVNKEGETELRFYVADWAPRNTGDLDSTPFPEVVSVVTPESLAIKTLASVGLYQSRLVLLGGPYLSMSRTNSFFDLFPASMLTEVDTDPINLLITGQKGQMVNGFHVIPTEHDVLVLGDTHQVDIGSDTGVMSPTSVYSKPKTAYTMDPGATPALVGDSIYFIDARRGYAACQQYGVRDSAGGRYAAEINQHCPTYLKGRMDVLVGTPQGMLLLKPAGTTKTVYVYQFIDSAEERVQSAWSRWEYAGHVLNAEFREGNLHVLVSFAEGRVERLTHHLDVDSEAEDIGIPLKLDSRKNHGSVKPTNLREGEIAIRRHGVWFTGFTYMQRHVLSTLYFWNQSLQQAVTSGRLQIRRIKFLYRDTTEFNVLVNRRGEGRSSVRSFRGRVIGSMNNLLGKVPVESGQFTVPVLSRNTDVTLTIENNGPHDACFLSAEWDGFYNTRTLQW
ncbi:hypothetical protein [Aeromonas enteropelogenes]|uniref:phage nozzle protein n=1 Tax=Aeromonas enteropelogenes TaxID=29489 RepID=UPI001CBB9305|nr:hypothetical protein [Aeromonas enteropelogenes]UAK70931.1 hypothetical protein K8O95_14785 [Aeromonas enteropelogenes]